MAWYDTRDLLFAVGIEDTFITQTPFGERPLDEYELTQHYTHWHADLRLAKESGATLMRWGVPWHLVNPARGTWDWDWIDRVADRFHELGLKPIVDLMHYGTPRWLDNEFANHDYPAAVAEYAATLAQRYPGVFDIFTPLNEPLLNVAYCGEFGYWPPYLRGDDGFVKLAIAIAKGIVLSQRAIADVNPAATFLHVEASFRFSGEGTEHAEQMWHLRQRAYLMEDLVTGNVDADHPLAPYLQRHGADDRDLAWLLEHPAWPDVMGVNYYPHLSTEAFVTGESHDGGPRDPRPRTNAWTDGLAQVLRAFAERYRRPVFLTETCFTGTTEDQIRWLDASVACVQSLRARGTPVIGYTWWPLIDMFEWTYRDGTRPLDDYLLRMGLWALERDGQKWQRVRTATADRFRDHALGLTATTETVRQETTQC